MRSPAWIALIVALSCAPGAQAATYVIAAGNNQGRADEPRLRYAERDAQEVTDVLRRLGRVSAENTRLLLGEDAEALRRVLLNTNVQLRAKANSSEEDALIIYYSGHADAAGLHLGQSVLPFDELKALVESSSARIRLLIIDSCRSGGITEIKGAVPAQPFAIQIDHRLDAEGLAIITSSAETEDSQESETLRASFFTHHFVTALRGAADLDRDGRITLNEAYGYAYRGTINSSGRTTKLQHPTYRYELKGKGDFVLTFLQSSPSQMGRISISEAGSYLVLEGHEAGLVIAEMTVEPSGARLVLPPGKYLVRRRADTFYREYSLELAGGSSVELLDQPFEEVTYARLLRKGGGARASFHALSLMGFVGGPVAEGFGFDKAVSVGYALDFSWLTFGAELRLGLSSASNATVDLTERSLAVRLRAERFIDLSFMSVALGVLVEGAQFRQSFTSAGDAPDRDAWSVGFGSLVAVERAIVPELALRLELGLVSYILPVAELDGGAAVSSSTENRLRPFVGLGGRWSL